MWLRTVAMLVFGLSVAACGLTNYEATTITFVNETDTAFCYNSPVDAGESCSEVKPNDKTDWELSCGYGEGAGSIVVKVVLAVKDQGTAVYSSSAPCHVWQEADTRIVIEQDNDEFLVTDNLPPS